MSSTETLHPNGADHLRDLIEEALGAPIEHYAHDCHAASVALVRNGPWTQARVARGTCKGVGGQHSWVVLGDDCYAERARLLDVTLWSYDEAQPVVWTGTYLDGLHRPHGHGHIYEASRPSHHGGETVTLDPTVAEGLDASARAFLAMIGPLDHRGWAQVAALPVHGWPAARVIDAMATDPNLRALVPIDRVGMLTNHNPQGLYLRGGGD